MYMVAPSASAPTSRTLRVRFRSGDLGPRDYPFAAVAKAPVRGASIAVDDASVIPKLREGSVRRNEE
jgi:hypothetical protein